MKKQSILAIAATTSTLALHAVAEISTGWLQTTKGTYGFLDATVVMLQ